MKSNRLLLGAICLAVTGLVALGSARGLPEDQTYTFVPVDFPGSVWTGVAAITPDRRIVGYTRDAALVWHGFVGTDAGNTVFDVPIAGATGTVPLGINSAGDIVGWFFLGSNVPHGFLLSASGSATVIDVPGAFRTLPHGINAAGDVVGFYDTSPVPDKRRGFLRSRSGTYSTIDLPESIGPFPNGTMANWINQRGNIVGTFYDGAVHGYLLSGETATQLDVPFAGVVRTQAWGMNSEGDIVGDYTVGTRTFAFKRDRHGRYESLDIPELADMAVVNVFGINPAGDIVGQYQAQATPTSPARGFVLYRTPPGP
jgi:hypothetical protein